MRNLRKVILKIVLSLSLIFCICSSLDVNAAEIIAQGTCGENVNWVITSDRVLTISGQGEITEASWRESGKMYKEVIIKGGVTRICDEAFKEAYEVRKIVVEEGVTSLGEEAFARLDAIVFLPNSVTDIGESAFSGYHKRLIVCCEKDSTAYNYEKPNNGLEYISLDEIKSGKWDGDISWTWNTTGTLILEGSGEMPYALKRDIEEFKYPIFHLVIKPGITSVSRDAFLYCDALKSVSLPDGIKKIDGGAFSNCYSLKEINLPNGLTSLGGSVFFSCTSLEEIVLPKGITSIVGWTFESCRKLKSITIPKSVEVVEFEAFWECSSLEEVTICEGVALLDSRAFRDCDGLKKITVLDRNTAIAEDAFYQSSADFTIYCVENSKAKQFAIENGYDYEIIEFHLETDDVTEYFSDVHNFQWFADEVQFVYDHGLMTGKGNSYNFKPSEGLLRQQVATILYRMEGSPKVTSRRACEEFVDVDANEWYTDAVCWAYEAGIITGNPSTKEFKPNAGIYREQLVAMLYRYTVYKGLEASQAAEYDYMLDADQVSNWAVPAMKWAVGAGIISGYEYSWGTELLPRNTAKRSEMAAMLTRYYNTYNLDE